jgi:hypothetical protein
MIKLANDTSTTVKGTYTAKDDLQKKVAYENALSTTFTYQTEGGTNKKTETSTSCLYVSRDTPKTANLFHTVVHIGCAAASGKSMEQDVFDAIWSKFAGNDICISRVKIDGGAVVDDPSGKLYYYGKKTTGFGFWPVPPGEPANERTVARDHNNGGGSWGVFDTKIFLEKCDGTCGAWQNFAIDVTGVHSLKSSKCNIVVKYPKDLLYVGVTKGSHHGQVPYEKSWADHAVIGYKGSVCDTSYGENYGVLNPLIDGDMVTLTKKFEQFGVIINKVDPTNPLTWIIDWESSANADETWIIVTVFYEAL